MISLLYSQLKVHRGCVDDRGKQAQQLVQVWWCPVQLDVTMWCSVNLHNQLLLLCHYAWQGWGTAVASEPHLLSCLCIWAALLCVDTTDTPVQCINAPWRTSLVTEVSLFRHCFVLVCHFLEWLIIKISQWGSFLLGSELHNNNEIYREIFQMERII